MSSSGSGVPLVPSCGSAPGEEGVLVDLVSEGSGVEVSSGLNAPDPEPFLAAAQDEQVVQAEGLNEDPPADPPAEAARVPEQFGIFTPIATEGAASAPSTAVQSPKSIRVRTAGSVGGQVVDAEEAEEADTMGKRVKRHDHRDEMDEEEYATPKSTPASFEPPLGPPSGSSVTARNAGESTASGSFSFAGGVAGGLPGIAPRQAMPMLPLGTW